MNIMTNYKISMLQIQIYKNKSTENTTIMTDCGELKVNVWLLRFTKPE